MSIAKWLLITAAILGVLSWSGRSAYHSAHFVSTDDAQLESQVGSLAPRVSGVVSQVLVSEHQLVRKGQLLLRLDPADYESRLRQAKAKLATLRQTEASRLLEVEQRRTETVARRAEAQARIQVSQAQLEEARRSVAVASSSLESRRLDAGQMSWQVQAAYELQEQAQRESRAAAAETKRARQDWQRYQHLYAEQAIARQILDNSEAELTKAAERQKAAEQRALSLQATKQAETIRSQGGQAEVQVQQGLLEQSQATIARYQAEIAQAQALLSQTDSGPTQVAIAQRKAQESQAAIEEAREEVRQAELALSYTKLYAPWDGRVGQRPVEVGSYLQSGENALELVSVHPWVMANFKETQLERVSVGQQAWVEVDALPGRRLRARVDSIQPGTGSRFSLIPPQNASGNWVKVVQRVPVKLTLQDAPDTLAPGLSAWVEVESQR